MIFLKHKEQGERQPDLKSLQTAGNRADRMLNKIRETARGITMSTTVKAIVSTALVMVLGTAAVMANPRKTEKVEATNVQPRFQKTEMVCEYKKPKMDKIGGVISVSGKNGAKVVTITTSDKKTYILNTISGPKADGERKHVENKEVSAEKNQRPEMGQRKPRMDKFIKMEELVAKKGQKVAVEGFLNKDSNVFTVVDFFRPDPALEK